MILSITLIKRNIKLFFKDKGMFLTAFITPIILLVLYIAFLGSIFKSGISQSLASFKISENIIDSIAAGQLIKAILSVSCVTIAFCANFIMVQDKANNTIKDLTISPVKSSTLALSYYIATFISTMLICIVALAFCLGYIAYSGWYMSLHDVLALLLDVFILVLFGTSISSIINCFLSTQGQISAVGTIISAGYGFICGAYMPINSLNPAIHKILSFLPSTYGTSLIHNHALQGTFNHLNTQGVPVDLLNHLKDSLDLNIYFSGKLVNIPTMYAILIISNIVLLASYILIHKLRNNK